jgi:hypothetical protein
LKEKNFCLGAVLPSRLVSEEYEPPSRGLESRIFFRSSLTGLNERAWQVWCKSVLPFSS